MKSIKLRCMAAAISGALLMGFGANAIADSNDDIVYALISKGVLTEEEGALLLKGREGERAGQEKKMKSVGKIKVSDAIDNATVYGDVRVRYEDRSGDGVGTIAGRNIDASRDRARYKLIFGVKTEAGDFYSDLAFAMGAGGRSDNATFGTSTNAGSGGSTYNDKQTLFVKRAMVGWKATDWLTLEAGRMDNPLYTTPMVWDADLSFQGLTEKIKYTTKGNTDLFFTASQFEYLGDKRRFSDNGGTDTVANRLLAFQGGLRVPFSDTSSAKAAITYSTFTHDGANGTFTPNVNTSLNATVSTVAASTPVNNIRTIEIPAEYNFMAASNIGIRVFGDYVYNIEGDDRADAACSAAAAGAVRNKVCGAGNDDTAWMLGMGVGSAKDLKAFEGNKMVKGDWSARLWYQDVGVYSVDPNAVDSDYMDSRVNMKGIVLKTQYNLRDNVFINFAAGHAKRKNNDLGTAGIGDVALNLKSFDLYQLDLTYRF